MLARNHQLSFESLLYVFWSVFFFVVAVVAPRAGFHLGWPVDQSHCPVLAAFPMNNVSQEIYGMLPRVLVEAFVVGIVLALVLALAVAARGPILDVRAALATGLVLGAAVHLGFEASGLNRQYCATGAACQS